MTDLFQDFSGRHRLPIDRFVEPDTLAELCREVRDAESRGASVHAMGSAWAFSAPAYCPGVVIRTNRLSGFPRRVQSAIKSADLGGGRLLVAVEAGIKIRNLYLALDSGLPQLQVSLSPATQPLGVRTTLTLTVRDDTGEPVPGAVVTIQNFNPRPNPVTVTTDAVGVAVMSLTLRQQLLVNPINHEPEEGDLPSGTVTVPGFHPAAVPFDLDPDAPRPAEAPDPDEAPPFVSSTLRRLAGAELSMPTLGGAAGQSLAGAISTGTHGGDVARPPIGDYVHAMVIVGSGGVVRLFQRDRPQPTVSFENLRANLSATIDPAMIVDATGTEAFEAALLSVGRFGVVYAYVIEVRDESQSFVFEKRTASTWAQTSAALPAKIQAARQADDFLQVVINPVVQPDGSRRCYITEHKLLGRDRVGDAFIAFDPPAWPFWPSVPVLTARAVDPNLPVPVEWATIKTIVDFVTAVGRHFGAGGPRPSLSTLCVAHLTPELREIQSQLQSWGLNALLDLMQVKGREMFRVAAESIGRIGPDHRLGDVLTDALNAGPIEIVDQILTGFLDDRQRNWLVHGKRWEICDTFDYANDCYRGDSVEVFFPADDTLPQRVEQVLGVFDTLRGQGISAAAYISLRFLAPTTALLGTAAFAPVTCAVEVAMLRGARGNDTLLAGLQGIAVANNGRIHWGQRNDLTANQVATMYGDRLNRWRDRLDNVEHTSPSFSNPFSVSHGLEIELPGELLEFYYDPGKPWIVFDLTAAAGKPIAGNPAILTKPDGVHVFARGRGGELLEFYYDPSKAVDPWTVFDQSAVTGKYITGDPAILTKPDGVHVFARGRGGELLEFYYDPSKAVDPWTVFDQSAVTGKYITGDPAILTKPDGVHVFARGRGGELLEFYYDPSKAVDPWTVFDQSAVTGKYITGDPAILTKPDGVHVFARGRGGELLEFYYDPGKPWIVFDLTAAAGKPIAGNPAILTKPDGVHVFARGRGGELLEFYYDPSKAVDPWTVFDQSAVTGKYITGDPAILTKPDGVHVFARGRGGELLEFYYDPGKPWIVFDLTAAAGKPIAGNPAILTKPDGVHVFARGLEPRDPPSRPSLRQLGVSVEPATIPAGMTTSITIRTIDAVTGVPVTGTATVHNFTRTGMPIEEVWPTNQPQRGVLRRGRAEAEPGGPAILGDPPSAQVTADGYDPVHLEFKLR